jgi:hypothetical protein
VLVSAHVEMIQTCSPMRGYGGEAKSTTFIRQDTVPASSDKRPADFDSAQCGQCLDENQEMPFEDHDDTGSILRIQEAPVGFFKERPYCVSNFEPCKVGASMLKIKNELVVSKDEIKKEAHQNLMEQLFNTNDNKVGAFKSLTSDETTKKELLQQLLDEALSSSVVKMSRVPKRAQGKLNLKEKIARVSLKSKTAIMKQHKGHRKLRPTSDDRSPRDGPELDLEESKDEASGNAKDLDEQD